MWTFPTLHKKAQIADYDIYWLRLASLLTPALLGSLDALAYAATPQVQSQWRAVFCRGQKTEVIDREEVESVEESSHPSPLYRWSFQSSDVQHSLLPQSEEEFVY